MLKTVLLLTSIIAVLSHFKVTYCIIYVLPDIHRGTALNEKTDPMQGTSLIAVLKLGFFTMLQEWVTKFLWMF